MPSRAKLPSARTGALPSLCPPKNDGHLLFPRSRSHLRRADGAPRQRLPQPSQPAFVCRQTLHLPRRGGSPRGTRRKRPRDGRRERKRPRGTRPLAQCRRGPNTRAAPSRPRLSEQRGGPGRGGPGAGLPLSHRRGGPGPEPRVVFVVRSGGKRSEGETAKERGKKALREREKGGDGLPAGPQSVPRRARSAVLPPSALSAAGRAAVRAGLLVSSQVVPKRAEGVRPPAELVYLRVTPLFLPIGRGASVFSFFVCISALFVQIC